MKKVSSLVIILFVVLIFSGCNKDSEKAKIQEETINVEAQAKLNEQQQQIDELQRFKDEQQLAEQEKQKEETTQKIADCEKRLVLAEEELEKANNRLNEDKKELEKAESGKYEKECLKKFGENPSKSTKETCEEASANNLKYRKDDIQSDLNNIKKEEQLIVQIKTECTDVLN
jgi:hypothetical protein